MTWSRQLVGLQASSLRSFPCYHPYQTWVYKCALLKFFYNLKNNNLGLISNFCNLMLNSHFKKNTWLISKKCFFALSSSLFALLSVAFAASLRGPGVGLACWPWPAYVPCVHTFVLLGKFLWRRCHLGRSFRWTGRKGDGREESRKIKKSWTNWFY